jgi:hypothetical protein
VLLRLFAFAWDCGEMAIFDVVGIRKGEVVDGNGHHRKKIFVASSQKKILNFDLFIHNFWLLLRYLWHHRKKIREN